MFAGRPNPTSSRLHFALASVEDAILQDMEDAVATKLSSASFATHMFDGGILKMPPDDISALEQLLKTVGGKWKVEFKVEQF